MFILESYDKTEYSTFKITIIKDEMEFNGYSIGRFDEFAEDDGTYYIFDRMIDGIDYDQLIKDKEDFQEYISDVYNDNGKIYNLLKSVKM